MMRDRIIECHVAWILGYFGSILVLILLAMTGILGTILRFTSPIYEVFLLLLVPTAGLLSCLYVCLKAQNRHNSIALHCREAINFQISYTGYQVAVILFLYSCWAGQSNNPYTNNNLGNFALLLMVSPLVPIIELCRFILTFIAVRKVSGGEFYYYPGNLRLWYGKIDR
jgi:uncharacterized Tic20 family protein